MLDYILLTEKKWHETLLGQLQQRPLETWHLVDSKDRFTLDELRRMGPTKIFIPHWSYMIPAQIYTAYECIVFHMTDLPYGRGGSPLQNLIIRGHKQTMLSALRVNKGIDTGDIYLKKKMSLAGTATEIFLRSVPLIHTMIEEIIDHGLRPKPQNGEAVNFDRRTPTQSNIGVLEDLDKVYDHIRMLDAESYPKAFVETEKLKVEFFNAEKKNDEIIANVRITKK